jgi:hypothetical protein
MVTLADKYAILGQHAQADMMRAQAEQARTVVQNHLAAEQARLLGPQFQDTHSMNAAKIGQMDYENAKYRADTNRTNMLAPAERDKFLADAYHSRAQGTETYGMLPFKQGEAVSRIGMNDANAYANRTQAYYGFEYPNRPDGGGPTPTNPRSLAYGSAGQGGQNAGGMNAGMATPQGSYTPGPDYSSLFGSGPSTPPPQAPAPPGPTPAQPAPARRTARTQISVDETPSSFAPRPPPLGSLSALSNPRARAGMGITGSPSASSPFAGMTGMVGSDVANSFSGWRDPTSGSSVGMVPSSSSDRFGWENPANRSY